VAGAWITLSWPRSCSRSPASTTMLGESKD
jgi:hypothetical protein